MADVPKLIDLSAEAVAKCLASEHPIPETPPPSITANAWIHITNLVLDVYYKKDYRFTETCIGFFKKCDSGKAILNRCVLNKNHCAMLFEHELEEVELVDLSRSEQFFRSANGKETDCPVIDINQLLDKIIFFDTRHRLKKLTIDPGKAKFQRNFIIKLAFRFRNLEKLVIRNVDIKLLDFDVLCCAFSKLKELDLSYCNLQNVTRISRLKNLEVLILRGLKIANQECIQDLWNLEKLRVLDISGAQGNSSQNLRYYMKTRENRPKVKMDCLQVLDCSFNEVKEKYIRKMLRIHPNLKTISLIGTNLQSLLDDELQYALNEDVKVLRIANLERCTEALTYYTQSSYLTVRMLKALLTEMCNQLESNYAALSEEALKSCLCELLNFLKKSKTEWGALTLYCIEPICRTTRSEIFDADLKRDVITQLITLYKTNPKLVDAKTIIWSLFNNFTLNHRCSFYQIDQICNLTLVDLEKCASNNIRIPSGSMRFLASFFPRLIDEKRQKLVEDRNLKFRIFWILAERAIEPIDITYFLTLIEYLTYDAKIKDVEICRRTVDVYKFMLEKFKKNSTLLTLVLKSFERILMMFDAVEWMKHIRKEDLLRVEKLITPENDAKKNLTHAASVFLIRILSKILLQNPKMLHRDVDLKNVLFRTFDSAEILESQDVPYFLEFVENFISTENPARFKTVRNILEVYGLILETFQEMQSTVLSISESFERILENPGWTTRKYYKKESFVKLTNFLCTQNVKLRPLQTSILFILVSIYYHHTLGSRPKDEIRKLVKSISDFTQNIQNIEYLQEGVLFKFLVHEHQSEDVKRWAQWFVDYSEVKEEDVRETEEAEDVEEDGEVNGNSELKAAIVEFILGAQMLESSGDEYEEEVDENDDVWQANRNDDYL